MMRIRQGKILLAGLASFFVLESALAKVEAVIGGVALKSNPNFAINIPTINDSEIIISRSQYVLSYNKNRRNPNWVAWKVDAAEIGDAGRSDRFSQDHDLEDYLTQKDGGNLHAVKPSEYADSCFDRGHQAPSADRSETTEDNQATFLMDNMLPQTPYLNRVVWMHLEQYTREKINKEGKKAYIIAGPIYDQNFGAIGPNNDIQVPSKNFKVIVFLNKNQTPADFNSKTETIAVIMPNVLEDGSKPTRAKDGSCKVADASKKGDTGMDDWQQYKTTMQDVEKQAGIKLFGR